MDDLTEEELFRELSSDFPSFIKLHDDKGLAVWTDSGYEESPRVVIMENNEQGIYHIGICWPYPNWAIQPIAQHLDKKIENLRSGVEVKAGHRESEEVYSNKELKFSDTVYLYANNFQKADYNRKNARDLFAQFGYSLRIRDEDYRNRIDNRDEWDAFISHDSSDSDFAQSLYRELFLRRVHTWYDQAVLKPGDSLVGKIDDGLSNSDRAVLIISEDFMDNVGWAYDEWQGIRALQNAENYNVILPVWYNVSSDEVREFSPFLSQLHAIRASSVDDAERVANEIKSVIS